MADANTRYPYSYAGQTLTEAELHDKTTVKLVDPEFNRRVFAMMRAAADAGVPLGIGTGWRVQPSPPPPGFASPGNSHHESMPAGSNTATAFAYDMVPASSWPWMEANCARFGIRTFLHVNNEPWHIQPVDIPAGRAYRTYPYTLGRFALPGETKPAPVFDPANGKYGLWPLGDKPTVKPGMRGDAVRYEQGVLKHQGDNMCAWFAAIARKNGRVKRAKLLDVARVHCAGLGVDGHYGDKTGDAVVAVKRAFNDLRWGGQHYTFGLDPVTGSEMWRFVDAISDGRY